MGPNHNMVKVKSSLWSQDAWVRIPDLPQTGRETFGMKEGSSSPLHTWRRGKA